MSSELMIMKIKYESLLNSVEDPLHPVVPNLQPRLNSLSKNQRALHLIGVQICSGHQQMLQLYVYKIIIVK